MMPITFIGKIQRRIGVFTPLCGVNHLSSGVCKRSCAAGQTVLRHEWRKKRLSHVELFVDESDCIKKRDKCLPIVNLQFMIFYTFQKIFGCLQIVNE